MLILLGLLKLKWAYGFAPGLYRQFGSG